MTIVICSDRDNTLNVDENYYLGSSDAWKEQLATIPTVIEGIKKLNTIPDSKFFIITNQAGVAIKEYDRLTEERAHEVNKQFIALLEQQGARVDGYSMCPYVDEAYATKKKNIFTIDNAYLKTDHPHLKPKPGMITSLIEEHQIKNIEAIYMIGDRISDAKTGLNAGGISLIIPSMKTGEQDKLQALEQAHPGRVHVMPYFLAAAEYILKDVAARRK